MRAYTRTHLAGDTFDRTPEGKIEVITTLNFAGSQHQFQQHEAALKSRIAALVQAQRPFSEAQKQKLVAVDEELLLSLDEPSLQVLAQQLNELERGALEVKSETIRAWIQRHERSLRRVKIAVTAENKRP